MATTGTDGKDTLLGGTGDDTLRGFLGDDTYVYNVGSGNDTIIDTGGIDTLLLGDPHGLYNGMDIYRKGSDLIFDFGSQGKAILQNQYGAATGTVASTIEYFGFDDEPGRMAFVKGLAGTTRNDFIVGTASAEKISGGLGNDWILGGAGKDTLDGGDGDDEIDGGLGNDVIKGGKGDDFLAGGAGSDSIYGGEGYDEVTYLGQSDGILVNLSGMTLTLGGHKIASGRVYEKAFNSVDVLDSIESIEGTSHADMVVFGQLKSGLSLQLGQGDDTIKGGDFSGSVNQSSVNVGYWNDPSGVIVNLSNSALTVKLGAGTYTVAAKSARDGWGGTDTFLFGSGHYFHVHGSDHADYIRGRDDANTSQVWEWFSTGLGNDTINGGTGIDTMSYDTWDESDSGVIVNLSTKAITVAGVKLQAGAARDNWGYTDKLLNIENINGSSLADYLAGSDGANNLQGGAGKDTLVGGGGGDFMDGGAGNDVFKFNSLSDFGNAASSTTMDYINNFVVGEDKIDLSAIDANPNMTGKQGFVFVDGMPTTYKPGQIWAMGGSVMINTDRDDMPEYQFYVGLQLGQPALSATDFIF